MWQHGSILEGRRAFRGFFGVYAMNFRLLSDGDGYDQERDLAMREGLVELRGELKCVAIAVLAADPGRRALLAVFQTVPHIWVTRADRAELALSRLSCPGSL